MIIDAHMHLPTDEIGWENRKKKLLEEMKRNGIDAGIIISDSETESEIGSTDDCVELFENCPRIFVAAGISPYIDYENQLQKTEQYCREKRIVGIKIYCGHEPIFIDDDILTPVFRLAARFSVPILFHSGWDNAQYAEPERVKRVSDLYPAIKYICCHCFYPKIERCFDLLKDCGNVFFDLSSIADSPERNPEMKKILEMYIPRMPARFLFGSDYASCDQRAHIEFCRNLCLSDENRKKLFYENAERIYSLK